MIMKKAIVLFPYKERDLTDISNTSTAVCRQLVSLGYEVKSISMLSSQNGDYRDDAEKDAFNLLNSGFDAKFILALDYGPWPGTYWNKANFPNVHLVYECGDEPQSFYSHSRKAHNSDLILTPDYRCHSLYSEVFKKRSMWWPQFAIDETYLTDFNDSSSICVTTCGDRGDTTRHVQDSLKEKFINKRVWGSDHANFLASGNIIFQESKNKEITRRVIEGACLGRCVVADRPAESSRYFDVLKEGDEVIWYDTKEEAVEKITYFLDHPEEAREIGRSAKLRVAQEHMCSTRIKSLIERIESL